MTNYILACVMMCKKPEFQLYLMHRSCRLVLDEVDALKVVRILIDIRSRTELVKGTRPAMDWQKLITDFNKWKQNQ